MTVPQARTSAYLKPRCTRGCTSRRRCWAAKRSSWAMSASASSSVRVVLYGFAK